MSLSKHFDNWAAAEGYNNRGGEVFGPYTSVDDWLPCSSCHTECDGVVTRSQGHWVQTRSSFNQVLLFPSFATLFYNFIYARMFLYYFTYPYKHLSLQSQALIVGTTSFSFFLSSFIYSSCFPIFMDPWIPKEGITHALCHWRRRRRRRRRLRWQW
jgi:hypothetical protein